ncbi:putative RNA-directed DNA polymerase [Helianthus annuus]|nr:putative RNA-directed DNA polymerase [Helianthus annuus]
MVPVDYGPIPTRIFNSWLEIPGLLGYVHQIGPTFRFEGSSDLLLATKLKWIKFRMKQWVTNHKASKEGTYKANIDQLEALELLSETRDLTPNELELRAECKDLIIKEDKLRSMDLQQKARVRWAVDGDENTRYFHGVINANVSCNRINGLKIDGAWVTDPTLVKDYVYGYFANKYSEPMPIRPVLVCPNLASLTSLEAESLIVPFTCEEVRKAVWDCAGDRAPGPDGINFRFLKKCWELFQVDFMRVFEDFFWNTTLNQGCTSSFLALIPKCNDPGGLGEYRPISLINCINKVISKVLVGRLKTVIHKLVSEEQTGFLEKRSILDGPLMLNELIAWMKRSKKEGMIWKVDLEKAYDSLSWDFLDSILGQMNFPTRWIKWVMGIVTSAKASVLVNGSPTQEFTCYRGLRQGDPLSPFLFVIAMEALSGVLKKACSVGVFRGIKCASNGPLISHFLYADDVVFLGEWSGQNAMNLKRILRCFYLASGLRVNASKSNLYGIGVDETRVQDMASLLKCKAEKFPFKYLGLYVGANMNLCRNWEPVVEMFRKRLSLWKAETISFGGKLTLVKSVLNALPTYFFSLYKAPRKIIDRLESIRRDFLWGGTTEHAKMCWVKWKKVMTPMDMGGLGLGSLREANTAMLLKWWWRFKVDQEGLWRKIIWSIHSGSRTWNFIPAKVSLAGPWKQVAKTVDELEGLDIEAHSLIRVVPGIGKTVTFWTDYWAENGPLYLRYPLLYGLERNKMVSLDQRCSGANDSLEPTFQWVRVPATGAESAELRNLKDELRSFNRNEQEDKWQWCLEESGEFTVKSLRKLLQSKSFTDLDTCCTWNKWSPIKVNFFTWRLALDRLPTLENLARRNIQVGSLMCKFCGEMQETSEHLFISCGLSQSVWEFVRTWCQLHRFVLFDVKDALQYHKDARGSKRWKTAIYTVIQTTLWCIWRARNEAIFNGKQPMARNIKEEIKVLGFLWLKNRAKESNLTWEKWCNFDLRYMGI